MKKLLIPLLFLFLMACSDKPSTALIERTVTSAQAVPGVFHVVKVEKRDGWMDGDIYVADVAYEIEFDVNSDDLQEGLQNGLRDGSGGLLQTLVGGLKLMAVKLAYGDFRKGDRLTLTNQFRFFQTERGWRLQEE